mgnify:CR=1 FL=1|jgi:hypothetical protein
MLIMGQPSQSIYSLAPFAMKKLLSLLAISVFAFALFGCVTPPADDVEDVVEVIEDVVEDVVEEPMEEVVEEVMEEETTEEEVMEEETMEEEATE